nr:ATP-binding protein [uncultured Chitinophaga sp.]
MELKLGYEVIDSYKRLSYKAWYALAEFVDNSTQSYRNNEGLLNELYQKESTCLTVNISYQNGEDGYIKIEDNSIGMDYEDLSRALTIGKKPANSQGRSKYGLGLKTAAFWFGNRWEIRTKKYGTSEEYHVTVDLAELISKQVIKEELLKVTDRELTPAEKLQLEDSATIKYSTTFIDNKDAHYTIVKIHDLNRGIPSRTASKTKQYLRSMYRYDLAEGKLILFFQGETLKWSKDEIMSRVLVDDSGRPFLKEFVFYVNGKRVHGHAGILEKGSRKDAGFSLLQAQRVIQGWPESYRPHRLFGDQEGGTNNLVNQRLFGEIFLDNFDVSHTKDEILFSEDEEEILENELFAALADYKKAAEEYRKPEITEDEEDDIDFKGIVSNLFQGMQSPRFSVAVQETDVLPAEIIQLSNEEYYERTIASEIRDIYTAKIAGITITVIINSESSVWEPYLVVRFRASKEELGILINKQHPHWRTMTNSETILNFVKHCIYDGIAEWKANWKIGSLDPDTIKMIKDNLLRQSLIVS